jgi:uncharacterized protein (DUF1499 family)
MLVYRSHRIWCLLAALPLAGCSSIVSPDYSLSEGHLAPCPANKDCVSSQDTDPALHIAPMDYLMIQGEPQATRDKAHADLVAAINAAGAARIVSNHRNYIRVEYPAGARDARSSDSYYQPENAVDVVEFYLPPTSRTIEMRSVGKLGLMENGAARERLERIRALFTKLQQIPPKP